MAHLGGKKTDGTEAWKAYISSNKAWKDLELQVETGIKSSTLFLLRGGKLSVMSGCNLKAGDKIKLQKPTYLIVEGKKWAEIKFGNKVGLYPITQIRKPSKASGGTLGDEDKARDSLDKLIKARNHPIDIVVLGPNKKPFVTAKNVVGCVKVSGTPKADFALVDNKNKMVMFISHKKAGGAKAFQQYSGVTESAGEKINTHPEVVKFMRAVGPNIKNQQLQFPMQMVIKDKKLINYAIFGPEFGGPLGIENVTLIGQGDPILKPYGKNEDVMVLDWSDHYAVNGDLSHFMDGDYRAVLGATFRAGRGFDVDGKRYIGARIGIYPIALMRRTGLKEVV